ncbi:DUF3024 domain-containing protein [Nocardia sp. NPDC050697]|uniref:DUF3024 domain-containing protein n=1 Tax=Nocardia sp. NPDC050697 TaxID=3155158 RepID=UPI0033EBCA7D
MSGRRLPDLDVVRVQRWCAAQVPEQLRGEIRVECDVAARHLTICECRPPWRDDLGPEWTRFPIAHLCHTKATRLWTLYWRDRHLKFHRYQHLAPSPHVQDLLDYLDQRADPIFWG